MQEKKGKIVTICGSKGGNGKSICTCLLGKALAMKGKKVLLIDMDLYTGSLAFLMGATVGKNIFTIVDDLRNNRFHSILDYISSISPNLDLMASPKDPRQARKIDCKYIPNIFSFCRYSYDYILVDTNAVLDDINIMTLDASNILLHFFTNEAMDLKNTKSFLSIMDNTEREHLYLVLNESMKKEKYFKEYDMKNILGKKIDYIIPSSFYFKGIDKYIMENHLEMYLESLLNQNGTIPLVEDLLKVGEMHV